MKRIVVKHVLTSEGLHYLLNKEEVKNIQKKYLGEVGLIEQQCYNCDLEDYELQDVEVEVLGTYVAYLSAEFVRGENGDYVTEISTSFGHAQYEYVYGIIILDEKNQIVHQEMSKKLTWDYLYPWEIEEEDAIKHLENNVWLTEIFRSEILPKV